MLDHKEGWTPKNWCFKTVVLEKTLECPLDCKDIKPCKPKGNQSWIFIGGNDTEAESLILRPPDAKSRFIRKDPDAGKDWRQEEKGTTQDEMVGWHHRLNGREFERAPGDGGGQGSLACCSPQRCKESDTTEWLNWTEYSIVYMWHIFFIHSLVYRHLGFFHVLATVSSDWVTKQQQSLSYVLDYTYKWHQTVFCLSPSDFLFHLV